MFEGLSKLQIVLIVVTLIVLAGLTVWGGWAAIHMSDGKSLLSRSRI